MVRAILVFLPLMALAQVTPDRLVRATEEPQNWLTYNGSYSSQRYSTLAQITPANAPTLRQEWVLQVRSLEKFETTPLVVDGIMYLTQAPNDVLAVDPLSGRVFWSYSYTPASSSRLCCGLVNRGLGILGDSLFMGTIDGHVVALDRVSGKVLWNISVAEPTLGYAITLAPLVIKDKVIVGTAGGEYGIRGFIAALDAKTGKEAWRFYTIPAPGEPGFAGWKGDSWKHGGASVWITGSYDPDTNLTYWGIGNPGPDYNDEERPGDNLYSDSVVALDADSGKLKWHFQFTPHDVWDYDSVQIPVLADIDWQGRARKAMFWANRNGFFYVLDRTTGEFLRGAPFSRVTWATGLDAKGRPMVDASKMPTREGVQVYPGVQGSTNWYSSSYSLSTKLFYIPTWANYWSIYTKFPIEYEAGQRFTGGAPRSEVPGLRRNLINTRAEVDGSGAITAIDPLTGEKKWEFPMTDVTDAGVLTTASDVLFAGGREGYFYALDARTGKQLWRAQLGGQVTSAPITYRVGARQFVAVAAGSALFTFALPE